MAKQHEINRPVPEPVSQHAAFAEREAAHWKDWALSLYSELRSEGQSRTLMANFEDFANKRGVPI